MEGRIVGFLCCLLCALPFFVIAYFDKDSDTPINFWSGDKSLKEKVTNVPGYNAKMAKLYLYSARALVVAGVCCFIHLMAGIILLCLECTAGFYIVYRNYRKILQEFSDKELQINNC